MENAKTLFKTKALKKFYYTDEIETTALAGVNLEVKAGEFVAIMGPSGCGKSTLLNIVGLLDNPSEGEFFFNDLEISGYNERKRADLRKANIGFVFQSFNLISMLEQSKKRLKLKLPGLDILMFMALEKILKALSQVQPFIFTIK